MPEYQRCRKVINHAEAMSQAQDACHAATENWIAIICNLFAVTKRTVMRSAYGITCVNITELKRGMATPMVKYVLAGKLMEL